MLLSVFAKFTAKFLLPSYTKLWDFIIQVNWFERNYNFTKICINNF